MLATYPQNAFIVNSGQTEFKISKRRQTYVEVPYEITMSKFWIDALNEALGLVAVDSDKCNRLTMAVVDGLRNPRNSRVVKQMADRQCGNSPDMRVFSKNSGNFFSSMNAYTFNDLATLEMINNELQPQQGKQHIGLRIDLIDAGGVPLETKCTKINTELFIRYSEPNLPTVNYNSRRQFLRPDIVANNKIYGVLHVYTNTAVMGELTKVKLSVQKTCN